MVGNICICARHSKRIKLIEVYTSIDPLLHPPTMPFLKSLTHPLIQSPTLAHSITQSITDFTHSRTYPPTQAPTHCSLPPTHTPHTLPPTHSLTHSSIYPLAHPPTHAPINTTHTHPTDPFIHPLTPPTYPIRLNLLPSWTVSPTLSIIRSLNASLTTLTHTTH